MMKSAFDIPWPLYLGAWEMPKDPQGQVLRFGVWKIRQVYLQKNEAPKHVYNWTQIKMQFANLLWTLKTTQTYQNQTSKCMSTTWHQNTLNVFSHVHFSLQICRYKTTKRAPSCPMVRCMDQRIESPPTEACHRLGRSSLGPGHCNTSTCEQMYTFWIFFLVNFYDFLCFFFHFWL